jgi:hypothetical protein
VVGGIYGLALNPKRKKGWVENAELAGVGKFWIASTGVKQNKSDEHL